MRKYVFITGSSRGIGCSIATIFAYNNYNVIINYNNDEIAALNLKNELIKEFSINVDICKCNIADEDDVKKMISYIKSKYNRIDCIVNNAGIANDSLLFDKSKNDFIKIYETNLVGPFLVTKYARCLLDNNSCIINIASTNGIDTYYPYSADYDASKAALISLTHNLAQEMAPIRVNAVAPGWINTDMNKGMDPEFKENEVNKILLKRFAEPEEVAKVVYFLASDDAKFINNAVIRVDGGRVV